MEIKIKNKLATVTKDGERDYTLHISQEIWREKGATEMVYLSDFLSELPRGCVFLKGVTGCGATSLALADSSNCIICLPTRNTVLSKWVIRDKKTQQIIGRNTEVFPIFGGLNDTKEELTAYINDCMSCGRAVKIVCTYDQMERLYYRLIGQRFSNGKWVFDNSPSALCININLYRLYIDEVHQVLEDYKTPERRENIRGMLNVIARYPKDMVTCMTATPLERKYFFDEISGLDILTVDYGGFFADSPNPDKLKRNIVLRRSKSLGVDVCKIVREYRDGQQFGNCHIFINSVNFIAERVIKPLMKQYGDFNVFKDKIRIVCGENESNIQKIRKAVAETFKDKDVLGKTPDEVDNVIMEQMKQYRVFGKFVQSINSETRKVNFYTKTAWLGADVFDKNGQIYIVSDGARKSTMADISTQYIQILGRIRDSSNSKVIHIYSDNRYLNEDGKCQFLEDMTERERKRNIWREHLQNLVEEGIDDTTDGTNRETLESKYYLTFDKRKNEWVYDKYLQWNDEISYKVVHEDYRSGANLTKAMVQNGLTDVEDKPMESEKIKKKSTTRTSFKKLYLEYVTLRNGNQNTLFADVNAMINLLETREPYLFDAYEMDKRHDFRLVRALNYKRNAVISNIKIERNSGHENDIKSNIKKNFRVGVLYSTADKKNKLATIENKLHLKQKIKLEEYCKTESVVKRVNGKPERLTKIIEWI